MSDPSVKKLPLEVFEDIYSKVPRLCVEILIKKDNKYLMVKRSIPPGIGYWFLPGGTVLFNESIDGAVKRVAKEELGVEVVKTGEMVKVIEWVNSKNTFGGHAVSLLFEISEYKGEIVLDSQASEYKFMEVEK